MDASTAISDVVSEVETHLRRVGTQRDVTPTELAAATGVPEIDDPGSA